MIANMSLEELSSLYTQIEDEVAHRNLAWYKSQPEENQFKVGEIYRELTSLQIKYGENPETLEEDDSEETQFKQKLDDMCSNEIQQNFPEFLEGEKYDPEESKLWIVISITPSRTVNKTLSIEHEACKLFGIEIPARVQTFEAYTYDDIQIILQDEDGEKMTVNSNRSECQTWLIYSKLNNE